MNLCILPREMYCTSSVRTVADSSSLPVDPTVNIVSVLILPVVKPARKLAPSTPLPKNTKMMKSIRRTQKHTAGWTPENALFIISEKEFIEWSKTAREKRKLCEEGQITLAEFQAWLDESKCR